MKMKYLLAVVVGAIGLLVFLAWPWMGILLVEEADPPAPEIQYGEFPFKLKYELNGEILTVEDTLICEFAGYKWNEGVGKYRSWKARLVNGNDTILLLKIAGPKRHGVHGYTDGDKNRFKTEIFFDPGIATYYMGDGESKTGSTFPDAEYITRKKSGREVESGMVREKDLLEVYGIKLLSLEIAEPIQNSFVEK